MTAMIRITSALLLCCFFLSAAATTNPVDDYTQAFAKFDTWQKEELAALDDPAKTPLDQKTAAMLKSHQDIADLLLTAAVKSQATWPDAGGDIQPALKQLNPVRRAASYLLLQSRFDLSQNHPDKALDDAVAMLAMSRHAAQRNLLVYRLVAQAVETMGTDRVAAMLPSLPKDLAAKLPDRIAKLPPMPDGKAFMAGEFAFARQAIRVQKGPAGFVDVLEPFYKNVGEAMSLPPAEFNDKLDAETAKVMLNPFAKNLAPSLKRFRENDYALEAKRALLNTAIDMTINGEAALAKSKDVEGGGPFTSKPAPHGYTLVSKVQRNNKPVTLTVGE